MAGVHLAYFAVANDEASSTLLGLVFDELERAGPLIGHVHQAVVAGEVRGALHPQQTLPGLPVARFGQRLALGHLVAAVQDLIGEPQCLARRRIHGEHVVAKVSAVGPLADLSEVLFQRLPRRVVQLRRVVDHQHRVIDANSRYSAFKSAGDPSLSGRLPPG